MNHTQKIGIGTVQWGIAGYGINNQVNQVSDQEIDAILDLATSHEIEIIDTAGLYGNSEERLGTRNLETFKVVSKLPACSAKEVNNHVSNSLESLRIHSLYGYLFHDFNSFKKEPDQLKYLLEQRSKSKIQKVGFSLYRPEELEYLLEKDLDWQLLQIPFNILDQRFVPYFGELKKRNIEIHIRSIFLQGIFFMNPEKLIGKVSELSAPIKKMQELAKKNELKVETLAFQFGIQNKFIDKIIVGLESSKNLNDNIALCNEQIPSFIFDEINQIEIKNKELLIPSNWK